MAKIYGNPITLGGSSNKSDFQLAATFEIKSSDFTDVRTYESTGGKTFTEGTFQIPFPLVINKKTYNSFEELISTIGSRRNILFASISTLGPTTYASNKTDQSNCYVLFESYTILDTTLYMFVKFKK